MALYLKRNTNRDLNHCTTDEYFKPGFIYKLISLHRYSTFPATVKLRTRGIFGQPYDVYADLSCFSYVRERK